MKSNVPRVLGADIGVSAPSLQHGPKPCKMYENHTSYQRIDLATSSSRPVYSCIPSSDTVDLDLLGIFFRLSR